MLNDIKSREDVMFTVELGMRAYVCLSTENDPIPSPYIAGISGYIALTSDDQEWIDIQHWWVSMWDSDPGNFTLKEGLRQMVHDWQDLGASEETIVTWWNAWESRPLYDQAYEAALNMDIWEEAVANGEEWAMSDE